MNKETLLELVRIAHPRSGYSAALREQAGQAIDANADNAIGNEIVRLALIEQLERGDYND